MFQADVWTLLFPVSHFNPQQMFEETKIQFPADPGSVCLLERWEEIILNTNSDFWIFMQNNA